MLTSMQPAFTQKHRRPKKIPDFGFKGNLFAETEFAPYLWVVEIDPDGFAQQVLCSDCKALTLRPKDERKQAKTNLAGPL